MKTPVVILLLATFSSLWFFQNCSSQHTPSMLTLDLPLTHPDLDPAPEKLEGSVIIGDKVYIMSVFRDVIDSSETTDAERSVLEYYMALEFNTTQHLWGRACNPYETGDLCGGASTNTAFLEMRARSSSGREASRIQVCRRIANDNNLLARIRSKVSGGDPALNFESAQRVVELFYPVQELSVIESGARSLLDLDVEMVAAGEEVLERWRLSFLSVCESSGWEAI